VGFSGGRNYIVVQGSTYFFNSTSWIWADLCSAGTLEVTAHGRVAGGAAPRLTVALDSVKVVDEPFSTEHTWKIKVSSAGRLILGYFNDYYAPPEDRNLVVTNLSYVPSGTSK